jgi:hypothetical protein
MNKEVKKSLIQNILRLEPGISLLDIILDKLVSIWPQLLSAFIAAGGATYFSSITNWAQDIGGLGVWILITAAFLLTYLSITLVRYQNAKRKVLESQASLIDKLHADITPMNAIESSYSKVKIKIADLNNPIKNSIQNKTFTNCQVLGPANVLLLGSSNVINCEFINCDFVVIRNNITIYNVIVLKDISFINCELTQLTFYIPLDAISKFSNTPGIGFISLTGDTKLDSKPHR